MIIKLPEGFRIALTMYVTSPSTNGDACITASGAKQLDDDSFTEGIAAALDTLNKALGVSDARLMTNAEINEYVRREEESEEEEDC